MNESPSSSRKPVKDRIVVLVNRSADIFRKESPKTFASHVMDYLATFLFKYEQYFVLEHALEEIDRQKHLPLTDDYELVIVNNHAQSEGVSFKTAKSTLTPYQVRGRLLILSLRGRGNPTSPL